MPTMKKSVRILGGLLFVLALGAVAFLLSADTWFRFQPTAQHRQAEALALIGVGTSFICMQLAAETGPGEKLKGMLLGLAFALWGGEQYLAPGALVTAIDSLVVTIFVADLGLVIWAAPRRRS